MQVGVEINKYTPVRGGRSREILCGHARKQVLDQQRPWSDRRPSAAEDLRVSTDCKPTTNTHHRALLLEDLDRNVTSQKQ